jgi:hypothetical protein
MVKVAVDVERRACGRAVKAAPQEGLEGLRELSVIIIGQRRQHLVLQPCAQARRR